ncbi:Hsp20/alpha crystallin family protein [Paraburkholderia silvatlantica]|uniref:HSP20 family protein n=1 Tax=Paraburkholderia silvatlantica TaxID=321895 RepID=A0ABR6FGI9_9BURK|nr:Hsp20/alpha crystallin family protein [Paraburkholderia silvatlantica]MBB2926536.1 HSP20 family protein [Paraburkholderia silvatlantica]PVY37823.1 heat shock protein Hsp20 [Paraburkholderia silvatlantica]PXW42787.1 heat shock protein Hsp20 [Paraburkholderia silvatlantica]
MSNLTRYDPFSMEPVSDLFQGLFRPMRGMLAAEESELSAIKLDLTESEKAYTVKAELPGVDKKDIDVKIDGNVVSIHAKVERKTEQKEGERVIRRERYSGSFARTFSLASDIDETTANAQYQDGVLSLTLPKKAAAEQKRLQIQ